MGVAAIEATEAAVTYIQNPEVSKHLICRYTKTIGRWCQDTLYGRKTHDYLAISGVSPRKVAKNQVL